jgi:hypothetical protein
MKTEMIINNVVIFDGVKEYSKDEVIGDSTLNHVLNTALIFGGFPTIIDKINEENGMLYIVTDSQRTFAKPYLKDVSPELYSEYLIRKP